MKKILSLAIAAILAAGCNNDAEMYAPQQSDVVTNPVDIELYGDEMQNVSFAPDTECTWLQAFDVTDNGRGTWSMATSGSLCLKLKLTNTGHQRQLVYRKHLALDIDGRAIRTPSALYNQQGRQVKYISVDPDAVVGVMICYDDLFLAMNPNWVQTPADTNATYSIDIRLNGTEYLYGCNLYAHHSTANGWVHR